MNALGRAVLIVLGTICVGLGILGIVLPVLPTTPFLLLAAFLYARSSDRFYNWLLTNRWFGPYIDNYRRGRGMPLIQKGLTIALLWLSIGYAAGFVVTATWLQMLLLGIAVGVTWHLLRIPTYHPADQQASPPPESSTSEEVL